MGTSTEERRFFQRSTLPEVASRGNRSPIRGVARRPDRELQAHTPVWGRSRHAAAQTAGTTTRRFSPAKRGVRDKQSNARRLFAFAPEGNTVGKRIVQVAGAVRRQAPAPVRQGRAGQVQTRPIPSRETWDDGRILHDLKQETTATGHTNATSVSEAALTNTAGRRCSR